MSAALLVDQEAFLGAPRVEASGESAFQRCVRLIQKHAPRLMRSGGGGLSKEGKPSNISEAQRQEMLRLANLGWTTLRIARELGLSQSPVSKHLRSMGVVRGTGWKPAKEASA